MKAIAAAIAIAFVGIVSFKTNESTAEAKSNLSNRVTAIEAAVEAAQ